MGCDPPVMKHQTMGIEELLFETYPHKISDEKLANLNKM
jgi:hypothetical protein